MRITIQYYSLYYKIIQFIQVRLTIQVLVPLLRTCQIESVLEEGLGCIAIDIRVLHSSNFVKTAPPSKFYVIAIYSEKYLKAPGWIFIVISSFL